MCLCLFLGVLGIFFGNKTSSQFVAFTSTLHMPGDLSSHILSNNQKICKCLLSCIIWNLSEKPGSEVKTWSCGNMLYIAVQLFSVCRLSDSVRQCGYRLSFLYIKLWFSVSWCPLPWLCSRLKVDSSSPPNVVEGGAQVKQNVNVECLMDFKDHPLIDIQFRYLSFIPKQVICSIAHSYVETLEEKSDQASLHFSPTPPI